MDKRAKAVLMIIGALVLTTATAIGLDAYQWSQRNTEPIRIFQRATGGLGMGAISTPMWQFINYDVRIQSVDDSITWPIPGGYSFGPDRTGTVTYFEEVPENQWIERTP